MFCKEAAYKNLENFIADHLDGGVCHIIQKWLLKNTFFTEKLETTAFGDRPIWVDTSWFTLDLIKNMS